MSASGTMRAISTSEVVAKYQTDLLHELRCSIESAVKSGRIRELSGAEVDELIARFREVTHNHIANVMLVTSDLLKPKLPAP